MARRARRCLASPRAHPIAGRRDDACRGRGDASIPGDASRDRGQAPARDTRAFGRRNVAGARPLQRRPAASTLVHVRARQHRVHLRATALEGSGSAAGRIKDRYAVLQRCLTPIVGETGVRHRLNRVQHDGDERHLGAIPEMPDTSGTDPALATSPIAARRQRHATLIGITRPRSAGPAWVAASPPRPCHLSSSTRHCARPVARLPSFTWP